MAIVVLPAQTTGVHGTVRVRALLACQRTQRFSLPDFDAETKRLTEPLLCRIAENSGTSRVDFHDAQIFAVEDDHRHWAAGE